MLGLAGAAPPAKGAAADNQQAAVTRVWIRVMGLSGPRQENDGGRLKADVHKGTPLIVAVAGGFRYAPRQYLPNSRPCGSAGGCRRAMSMALSAPSKRFTTYEPSDARMG